MQSLKLTLDILYVCDRQTPVAVRIPGGTCSVLKADIQRPPSRQARSLGLGGAQAPAIVTSLEGDSGTGELWDTFSYSLLGFQSQISNMSLLVGIRSQGRIQVS